MADHICCCLPFDALTGLARTARNTPYCYLVKSWVCALQEVGVKLDKHNAIKIDEYSRTSVDNIWSVGDVTMRMPLTPVAIMEGMAFAATCFGNKPTTPVHEKVTPVHPSVIISSFC